jgi:hypothetical protein
LIAAKLVLNEIDNPATNVRFVIEKPAALGVDRRTAARSETDVFWRL